MALTWAALRLGIRVLAIELAVFAIVVSLLTAQGRGPFAAAIAEQHPGRAGAGAAAQLFLLCTAIITLPLAVAALQSHLLLDRVRADELLFRRNFTESLVGMVFLAVEEVPTADRGRRGPASTCGSSTSTTPPCTSSAATGSSSSTPSLLELVDLGDDFDEALEETLAGERDGWQAECELVGARAGHVTLALSRLSEGSDEPLLAAQLLDVTSEHEARRSPGDRRAADQHDAGHHGLHHHGDRPGRHRRARQRGHDRDHRLPGERPDRQAGLGARAGSRPTPATSRPC